MNPVTVIPHQIFFRCDLNVSLRVLRALPFLEIERVPFGNFGRPGGAPSLIYIYTYIYIYITLSLSLSLSLSIYLSIYLSIHLSIYLYNIYTPTSGIKVHTDST